MLKMSVCKFCHLREGDVPVLGSEICSRFEQRKSNEGDGRSYGQWPDVAQ